jgi:hypothetical protein
MEHKEKTDNNESSINQYIKIDQKSRDTGRTVGEIKDTVEWMCGNQHHSLDKHVEQETVRLMKDMTKRTTEMRHTTESVG